MKKIVFDSHQIPSLPEVFHTYWGQEIKSTEDIWELSDIGFRTKFDFNKFQHKHIKYSIKLYLGTLAISKSLSHLHNCYRKLTDGLSGPLGNPLDSSITKVIDQFMATKRNTRNEFQIWYLKDWYLWCSDIGIPYFDENYAEYLSSIMISGNTKGQAVLSMEENHGPLTELELSELVALVSKDPHLSYGKVLTFLFLTLGSNPRNLSLLKWVDFSVISEGNYKVYLLNVPRIKKRTKIREDFKTRELDGRIGRLLEEFKKVAHSENVFEGRHGEPLTAMEIYNVFKQYISELIIGTSLSSINLSPRRLRYTFATRLVMSGVSKERLAELLDHTDLQNVQVYYDLRHKIKSFLTEAENLKLSNLLGRFAGEIHPKSKKIIKDIKYFSSSASGELGSCGSNSDCELSAPYSCFVCKKFNAFEDSLSWYKKVLKDLLQWKSQRAEEHDGNDRIASQMDPVISALKDLISRIEEMA